MPETVPFKEKQDKETVRHAVSDNLPGTIRLCRILLGSRLWKLSDKPFQRVGQCRTVAAYEKKPSDGFISSLPGILCGIPGILFFPRSPPILLCCLFADRTAVFPIRQSRIKLFPAGIAPDSVHFLIHSSPVSFDPDSTGFFN